MMAGIKGKNTAPELFVRRTLHRQGFRYRVHDRNLAGRPDIVLKKHQAVIFVHGCFWHGHECHIFKWPKTRKEFWQQKISKNNANDIRNISNLRRNGWRVAVIWECALLGDELSVKTAMVKLSNWIAGESMEIELTASSRNE